MDRFGLDHPKAISGERLQVLGATHCLISIGVARYQRCSAVRFRERGFSIGQVYVSDECKNAGHLCVSRVDTRIYGTYLGASPPGDLCNNG
jgi:hypothetical protein